MIVSLISEGVSYQLYIVNLCFVRPLSPIALALPQQDCKLHALEHCAFSLDAFLDIAVIPALCSILPPVPFPSAPCSFFSQRKMAGANVPAIPSCILSCGKLILFLSASLSLLSLSSAAVFFICSVCFPPGSPLLLSRYLLPSLPPARRRSRSCPCGRYRSRCSG